MNSFIKYNLVGGSIALLDIFLVYLLTSIFNFYYLLSVLISVLICSFISFKLNKKYTFNNTSRKNLWQYLSTLYLSLVYIIFTLGLMELFVEWIGFYYLISKALTVLILVFLTYGFNKYVTYGVFFNE